MKRRTPVPALAALLLLLLSVQAVPEKQEDHGHTEKQEEHVRRRLFERLLARQGVLSERTQGPKEGVPEEVGRPHSSGTRRRRTRRGRSLYGGSGYGVGDHSYDMGGPGPSCYVWGNWGACEGTCCPKGAPMMYCMGDQSRMCAHSGGGVEWRQCKTATCAHSHRPHDHQPHRHNPHIHYPVRCPPASTSIFYVTLFVSNVLR